MTTSTERHFLNSPRAYLRELAEQWFNPVDEVDRDRAGRDLIEASVARREAARLAAEYEPTYLQAARAAGDENALSEVFSERRRLNELRASVDTSGLHPTRVTGDGATGLGDGLGLIRSYATIVVPDEHLLGVTIDQAPADVSQLAAIVDPSFPMEDTGGSVDVEDVRSEWHRSVMPLSLARQVLDFGGDTAAGHIDRLLEDAADRAAEKWIGTQMLAAAGDPLAGAANLAESLDELESRVAERGQVYVLAHPVDLPQVRRAVATSWTDQLPHPVLISSIGAPEGTALGFGADAVTLEATEHEVYNVERVAGLSTTLAVARPFRLAVTSSLGVAALSLEA